MDSEDKSVESSRKLDEVSESKNDENFIGEEKSEIKFEDKSEINETESVVKSQSKININEGFETERFETERFETERFDSERKDDYKLDENPSLDLLSTNSQQSISSKKDIAMSITENGLLNDMTSYEKFRYVITNNLPDNISNYIINAIIEEKMNRLVINGKDCGFRLYDDDINFIIQAILLSNIPIYSLILQNHRITGMNGFKTHRFNVILFRVFLIF